MKLESNAATRLLRRRKSGPQIDGSAPMILRDARRDEVPLIVAMLADDALGGTRDKVTDPLPEAYYAAFDAIAASRDNRLLIAELDGEVVGTLQLTFIPGLSKVGAEKMLIEAVRVVRARRGTGIGGQIVAAAIELARARRCKSVELSSHQTRTDAHRFYARLGFVASHVGMKLALD
jgi:GNAT superfamily N-acetyltransferase